MMKVLFINSCIRGTEVSRTKRLCDVFLKELHLSVGDIELTTIDVNKLSLHPMTQDDLKDRNELISNKEYDNTFFRYAKEFAEADFILIGAPFWNLSFPSALKVYLEWVCMSGVTFCYEGSTCVGLCKAGELMLISTAGFNLHGVNNGVDYLRQLSMEFFGIKSFEYYCAEELDVKGTDAEEILENAEVEIRVMAKSVVF